MSTRPVGGRPRGIPKYSAKQWSDLGELLNEAYRQCPQFTCFLAAKHVSNLLGSLQGIEDVATRGAVLLEEAQEMEMP